MDGSLRMALKGGTNGHGGQSGGGTGWVQPWGAFKNESIGEVFFPGANDRMAAARGKDSTGAPLSRGPDG